MDRPRIADDAARRFGLEERARGEAFEPGLHDFEEELEGEGFERVKDRAAAGAAESIGQVKFRGDGAFVDDESGGVDLGCERFDTRER